MRRVILHVAIFAIAFGFLEAAVVVYLRHLVGASGEVINPKEVLFLVPGIAFLEPQTAVKIVTNSQILTVEQIREAATIIMLFSVASLASKNLKQIAAFFFLAFGIWDIFYYVFLRLAINWPASFADYDIFFLLPVPWVGPIVVPVIISLILILSSLLYLLKQKNVVRLR